MAQLLKSLWQESVAREEFVSPEGNTLLTLDAPTAQHLRTDPSAGTWRLIRRSDVTSTTREAFNNFLIKIRGISPFTWEKIAESTYRITSPTDMPLSTYLDVTRNTKMDYLKTMLPAWETFVEKDEYSAPEGRVTLKEEELQHPARKAFMEFIHALPAVYPQLQIQVSLDQVEILYTWRDEATPHTTLSEFLFDQYEKLQGMEMIRPVPLTESQIQDVTNILDTYVSPTANLEAERLRRAHIKENLASQLRGLVVPPLSIPIIRERIRQRFTQSLIDPGANVGINASEAVGEQFTQMTMKTFHQGGAAKSMSVGIKGMKELTQLSPYRKAPFSFVHFVPKQAAFYSFDEILNRRKDIVGTTIDYFLVRTEPTDPHGRHETLFLPAYVDSMPTWAIRQLQYRRDTDNLKSPIGQSLVKGTAAQENPHEYICRLYFNPTRLLQHNMTLGQIVREMEKTSFADTEQFDDDEDEEAPRSRVDPPIIFCLFSPTHLGIIDVFIDVEKARAVANIPHVQKNISSLFIQSSLIPYVRSKILKGIPNITDLTPERVEVLSAIGTQQKIPGTSRYNITLNRFNSILRGFTPQMCYDFFVACFGPNNVSLDNTGTITVQPPDEIHGYVQIYEKMQADKDALRYQREVNELEQTISRQIATLELEADRERVRELAKKTSNIAKPYQPWKYNKDMKPTESCIKLKAFDDNLEEEILRYEREEHLLSTLPRTPQTPDAKENADLVRTLAEAAAARRVTTAANEYEKLAAIHRQRGDEIRKLWMARVPEQLHNYNNPMELQKFFPTKIQRFGAYYYALCEGANLIGLCEIDDIDMTRSYTNDFYEMYQLFGIDAFRSFHMKEYVDGMSASGAVVDARWIGLIVDHQTVMGYPYGMSSAGLNKREETQVSTMTFERTYHVSQMAALFNRSGTTKAPSIAIMVGSQAKTGTGTVEVKENKARIDALKEAIARKGTLSSAAFTSEQVRASLRALPTPAVVAPTPITQPAAVSEVFLGVSNASPPGAPPGPVAPRVTPTASMLGLPPLPPRTTSATAGVLKPTPGVGGLMPLPRLAPVAETPVGPLAALTPLGLPLSVPAVIAPAVPLESKAALGGSLGYEPSLPVPQTAVPINERRALEAVNAATLAPPVISPLMTQAADRLEKEIVASIIPARQ